MLRHACLIMSSEEPRWVGDPVTKKKRNIYHLLYNLDLYVMNTIYHFNFILKLQSGSRSIILKGCEIYEYIRQDLHISDMNMYIWNLLSILWSVGNA